MPDSIDDFITRVEKEVAHHAAGQGLKADLSAIGQTASTVCFWDLSTKRCLKTFQCDSQITSILVHPLQDQFAAVCTDTTILIWPLPPT